MRSILQHAQTSKRQDSVFPLRVPSRPLTLLVSLVPISLTLMILGAASAWAHQCRFYRDDKRNLCLAKNEGKPFYCSFIRDPDQQRYCYAYVERTPAQCSSITDEALKAQCDAEAKARAEEAEAQRKLEQERQAAQSGARQPGATPPPAQPAGRRP